MKDYKRKVIRVFFSLLLGSLATLLFGCGRPRMGTLLMGWSRERIGTEISGESDPGSEETQEEIDGFLKAFSGRLTEDQTENVSSGLSAETGSEPENESETVSETILVHVCGAVVTSGVYAIPEGGRVIDAVEAAGGFAADAAPDYINMAQVLYDGSKVIIPTMEEVAEEPFGQSEFLSGGSSSEREGSSEGERKININTASAEELMKLPGVGQTRADAIIAYRRREGAFTCAEDLTKVSGIGENIFLNLKDLICIE